MSQTYRKCKHVDYTPGYFGVYGSLLGGSSPCHHDALPDSDFCRDHDNKEKRRQSTEEYDRMYGYFGDN